MGKGDKKSKKGKLAMGSFGVRRKSKTAKARAKRKTAPAKKVAAPKKAVAPKKAAAPKKATKKAE